MKEIETKKKPSRDYMSLSETDWSIWKTLYKRRSCRKYVANDFDEKKMSDLSKTLEKAIAVRNAEKESIQLITEKSLVEKVKVGSYKGIQNKINLWLMKASLYGFIVISVPAEDLIIDRPKVLLRSAIAVEDVVLWMVENGMGSCWLGALNEKEVAGAAGIEGNVRIPVIVCFGKPQPRTRITSFDGLMHSTMSCRRKPLSDIAFTERYPEAYDPSTVKESGFKAPAKQAVTELLDFMESGASTDIGISHDLAIDACLEAGRVSPNGGNSQRWMFVVVSGRNEIEDIMRMCRLEGEAKSLIVCAGDSSSITDRIIDRPLWLVDLPIAMSQMSLAAASVGLNTDVVTSGIDEGPLNGYVNLPGRYRTAGVIVIR